MKLTLAEPGQFKESINLISNLVNEARFKVNMDTIELVAMDTANVAMVIFKMFSSGFTEYDVKEETEIVVNLTNLNQILRRAKSNDILSFELVDNKLGIKLAGDTSRTFNLPLIELEEKEQKVPNLNFSVNVLMPSNTLANVIEDVDIVAESVFFEAEQGKFILNAEADLSQAKIEITEGENTKIEASEKTIAKYSIEYLKKMIGGSKLSGNVELQFKKNYPLKLDFKVIDKVSLSFILAPRISDE